MAGTRVPLTLCFALLVVFTSATSSPDEDFSSSKQPQQTLSPFHKAVSEAAYALMSGLGWSDNEAKISHIDTIDAKFGQTVMFEVDIELGEKVIPLRLSGDIPIWKYIEEIPAGISESSDASVLQSSPSQHLRGLATNLGPFQLSGPVELWIQDAELFRLAVPDEIEAGDLKKVLLADGAVVTVEGAREVSLVHPLQLPLPLPGISRDDGRAASLSALADRLKYASQAEQKPLLSLKIVGPTSMVASSNVSSKNSLKVERLAPGAIKLESNERQERALINTVHKSITLRKSDEDAWLWPLPSVNVSDPMLIDLEGVILSAMGPSVYKKGYFNLLRAQVSMATFVRVEFQLERKLSEGSFTAELWPEWRTKPSIERLEFELLAKLEGQELTPISVKGVQPYANIETSTWSALMGNVSFSKMPRVHLPPSAMTLNLN